MNDHRNHFHHHSSGGETTRDFTVGSPWKIIVSFAIPIFISQFFQQLYSAADALIVGHYLGTEALAAVSSSGTLIHLTTSFVIGTAMGAGVVISHAFGAGDCERVSRAIHSNIALAVSAGCVLTVLGVVFTPTVMRWIKVSDEVFPKAVEYFRFYFAGVLAVLLYNVCQSIMNALGDSRRPLYYLIFSSFINIGLDILFIGVLHWGVWSAAVATVISQAASVVLCFIHLCKKGEIFTVELGKVRFYGDVMRDIMIFGMPSGVQNSVIGFANIIVQAQINSFGTLATAAYGAHAKIEGFYFLPVISFSMALSTFIGQNLGAAKYERAKQGARFGVITSVVMAELIGFASYAFAPQLIAIFDDSPGVIELGVMQARIVSLFLCLLAFSHVIAAVCRGAGKAFVPMIVMIAVWCCIRVAYIAFVMKYFGELRYIYWAYPLTWGISSAIYLVYYLKSDWVHGFEDTSKIKTA